MTFVVLIAIWEGVLRKRASAAMNMDLNNRALVATSTPGEEWLVAGNCLMMTGVSPKRLTEQLAEGGDAVGRDRRLVLNIASHEQSPIAFFEYLEKANHYPDVMIVNISSWLNGSNFEQEGEVISQWDPLSLLPHQTAGSNGAGTAREQAYRNDSDVAKGSGEVQRKVEDSLSMFAAAHLEAYAHRYHLFDYSLFLGTLATRWDLDVALYQLNMQAWFRVTKSQTDGFGFIGLSASYRDDWSSGVDMMAERSLQRLRFATNLTPRYWELLTSKIKHFQSKGTQVLLVRMPEHPRIRAFNDETHHVPEHLATLERDTGSPYVDLSALGPADGVRLFDAVHPDAAAAEVITRELAGWLRTRKLTQGARREHRAGGG